MTDITPPDLLAAYCQGYFPMAKDKDSEELYWFFPEERGIIPLDGFRISRSLRKRLKEKPFVVTADTAFEQVMRACAEPRPKDGTWINETIIQLYCELHRMGFAHSVECWVDCRPDDRCQTLDDRTIPTSDIHHPTSGLVGGLYGVSIGGAFFGESMFSRRPDASKIALVHLVEVLKEAGYQLLDTQWVNPHLEQFGCIAITPEDYLMRLENALCISPNPSSRFSAVAGSVLNTPLEN